MLTGPVTCHAPSLCHIVPWMSPSWTALLASPQWVVVRVSTLPTPSRLDFTFVKGRPVSFYCLCYSKHNADLP